MQAHICHIHLENHRHAREQLLDVAIFFIGLAFFLDWTEPVGAKIKIGTHQMDGFRVFLFWMVKYCEIPKLG